MKSRYPVYNLLDQEIKACADHLLEMSQSGEFCQEKDAHHVLGRLAELHQFSLKIRPNEHYNVLSEFKEYLENTMLKYQDEQNRYQTMRLSEVISLLGIPNEDLKFDAVIVTSLIKYFIRHFQEEVKPGRLLFLKLHAIKRM